MKKWSTKVSNVLESEVWQPIRARSTAPGSHEDLFELVSASHPFVGLEGHVGGDKLEELVDGILCTVLLEDPSPILGEVGSCLLGWISDLTELCKIFVSPGLLGGTAVRPAFLLEERQRRDILLSDSSFVVFVELSMLEFNKWSFSSSRLLLMRLPMKV